MNPEDSLITPGRVRRIRVVALTFVIEGTLGVVSGLAELLSPTGQQVSLLWIAELPVGIALLRLRPIGHVAGFWLAAVKAAVLTIALVAVLALSGAWLLLNRSRMLPVELRDSIPALIFIGFLIVVPAWQAWLLARPYVAPLFGEFNA